MAKKKQVQIKTSRMFFELFGFIILLIGLYLFLCIASYNPRDDSPLRIDTSQEITRNFTGNFGRQISGILFKFLGLSSFTLPLLILYLSYRLFNIQAITLWVHKVLAGLIIIVSLSSMLHLFTVLFFDPQGYIGYARETILIGGLIGEQLSLFITGYLGTIGAIFSMIAVSIIALFIILGGFSVKSIGENIYNGAKYIIVFFSSKFLLLGSNIRNIIKRIFLYFASIFKKLKEIKKEHTDVSVLEKELESELEETYGSEEDPFHLNQEYDEKPKIEKIKKPKADIENLKVPRPDINIIMPGKTDSISDREFEKNKKDDTSFILPPLSFMKNYPCIDRENSRDIFKRQSRELESKLLEHRIAGNVIDVKPGPVITRYDFRIAPSIKIKSIKNLEEDISLALGVSSIRILPVPANRSLGFEIPNDSQLREIIGLKDIIKSSKFISNYKIPIALGKDIAGNPVVTDLSQMPHLLIGGATGSGKSVCLNSLLISLLYRFSPDELQLILIDPKQIEFGLYEDLPHLIAPVITDPYKSLNVLKWAVGKMEECYNDIAAQKVRNIYEYNQTVKNMHDEGYAEEEIPQLMPYRVIVIDEFGDLMMTSKGSNLDECILRLAQKARAVGIHLIMATQRPSVDVITGLIKANLRARIAFRVTQGTDSKTILDRSGAEKLLGRGDMFYRPPDDDILQRVHGAFISTNEIKKIVEFIKDQREPDYDEAILMAEEEEGDDIIDEIMEKEEDSLYPKAVDLVVRNKMASVSMLQRRLKIGHARASRMIDMMEYDNVVGPFVGSKMREVFLDENLLRSWLSYGKSRDKLREYTSSQ